MCNSRIKLPVLLFSAIIMVWGFPLHALNFPPGTTSHSCDVQADTAITFYFQAPLGVGNHRITVNLGFNASDGVSLQPNGVIVMGASQCPDCPCTMPNQWYQSGLPLTQKDTDSGSDSGYYLRLTNPSAKQYQLDIVAKPLNSAPWSGSGTEIWSVSLSFTVTTSYHFSLTSITADTSTTNLAFTSIDNCNAAPVASITHPQGSKYFINRGITIRGSATDPDTPLTYSWDLGGGGFTGSGGSLTAADPGKPIYFGSTGFKQIKLTATDSKGATSAEANKDLTLIDPADSSLQLPFSLDIPKKAANPPNIDDSDIAGDAGWNYARKLEYQNGGPPYLTLQYIVFDNGTDKDLYLSFEVTDNSSTKNDFIVLGFRPDVSSIDADRSNDRILIFDTSDDSLKVLGNSASWTDTGYSITNTKKKSTYGSGKWIAELKIPLKKDAASGGAQWINVSDSFLFYFNVIRTQAGPSTDQLSWPRFSPITSTGLPLNQVTDVNTFAYSPAEWGNASISATTRGGGVYLNWNGLGTTNADPTHIIFNSLNTFFANVNNNTTINTVPVDVAGVNAQFRIATWGFGTGPVPIDSLLGPATIPANGSYPFTVQWTPTDTNYETNCHQCIWVDLTASADVYIATPTVQRNMDFVSAVDPTVHMCPDPPPPPPVGPPVGDGKAIIGDEGQGDPPEGAQEHEILIEVNKEEYFQSFDPGHDINLSKLPPWVRYFFEHERAVPRTSAATTRSYIKWVASGQIFTGKYITIKGKQLKLYKPLGSFGYVVEHRGEVAGWQEGITGDKVQRIGSSSYRVMLPKDSRTNVGVEIKPIALNGWSLSVHGGLSVPLGSLASNAGLGGAVILDAGYQFTPQLALVVQTGFNYFFPQAPGGASSWAINFSPDLRYLPVPRGSLRVYVGTGPSILYNSSSAIDYGANVCAGLDFRLAPRFDLELGTMYHYLFPSNAQLLQLTLGGVYRF